MQYQELAGRTALVTGAVPDHVEFVDAFPQTGIGKVSKRDLRAHGGA
ncbi:hypothetical protein [Streptomyces sp. SPB162]|nr:hypothetical protein [Streptomyces sp. SPB162]MDF9811202.1 non-ribosomal peptide synthetase component E (peptide arylation enzyme) [Streptomyces sp. SPB162]